MTGTMQGDREFDFAGISGLGSELDISSYERFQQKISARRGGGCLRKSRKTGRRCEVALTFSVRFRSSSTSTTFTVVLHLFSTLRMSSVRRHSSVRKVILIAHLLQDEPGCQAEGNDHLFTPLRPNDVSAHTIALHAVLLLHPR